MKDGNTQLLVWAVRGMLKGHESRCNKSLRKTCTRRILAPAYLSWGTLAKVGANAVDAGSPIEARSARTVVDVLGADLARPAIDTDTREAADGVGAGGAVLQGNVSVVEYRAWRSLQR